MAKLTDEISSVLMSGGNSEQISHILPFSCPVADGLRIGVMLLQCNRLGLSAFLSLTKTLLATVAAMTYAVDGHKNVSEIK